MQNKLILNKRNTQFLIVGLGLIGGSIAKKLSFEGFKVFAEDKDKESIRLAKKNNSIKGGLDELDIKKNIILIFAIPPKSLREEISKYESLIKSSILVTECSSVKESIYLFFEKKNLDFNNLVLSHPIAGSENSGFKNSNKDLFSKKICIISKTKKSSNLSVQACRELWKKLGSNTKTLDIKIHDEVFALTSHLPHLIAFGLISTLSKSNIKNIKDYVGGGMQDFTRIAESDPIMWEGILSLNKKNILNELTKLNLEIENLKKILNQEDQKKIIKSLSQIQRFKKKIR